LVKLKVTIRYLQNLLSSVYIPWFELGTPHSHCNFDHD